MKYTAYLRTSETGENGLRYFGYTTDSKTRRGYTYTKDNNTWSKHLQQYPDYTTLTLYETDSQFDLTTFCINYSLKHGIWNNPGYANQMMENGLPTNQGITKKFWSKEMIAKHQDNSKNPEIRQKISDCKRKEKHHLWNKHHTTESKQQTSTTLKEHYKHKVHHLKGKPSHRKGIPLSEETKAKLSLANTGKNTGADSINAVQVQIGNTLHSTVKAAAEAMNCTTVTINNRVKHKTKFLEYSKPHNSLKGDSPHGQD